MSKILGVNLCFNFYLCDVSFYSFMSFSKNENTGNHKNVKNEIGLS
jgi:hypothetical protein